MVDPVLVCGAGIGGLSAAIALARKGVPVRVLEQAPNLSEAGAGIEIGPNAARHLNAWGLSDLLSTFSTEPEGVRVYDGLSGALLITVPLGNFARQRYGAPYLMVHRRHLQHCLLEVAGELDKLEIELGFKVSKVDVRPEGVTVKSETDDTAHGRALIGADGIWSRVRAVVSDKEPETVGVTAWRALVPASRVPEAKRAPYVGLQLGPGSHVLHYPVDAGATISVVAMIEETINFDGWASPGDANDLLTFFYDWDDEVFRLLELPDDWFKWTVMRMEPLELWGEGPMTLLGDAAHPIEPFMAQGGAAAIEDAASLADAVAANPANITAAFRAYEDSRQQRVIRIQKASQQRGKIYHMSGLKRWARNIMLRRQVPETLLSRYDWLYGTTNAAASQEKQ